MSTVCIITARGGSKRIPRKNIRDFCGKPIIVYSIEAALESGLFDEVMVSTDDEEIAEVARRHGASVPFMRSAENSDDRSDTADVLLEVLSSYEETGVRFDTMCCLYPTAPFATAEKLRESFSLLRESGCDGVVCVTSFGFPPQRAFFCRSGRAVVADPASFAKRSQDLEAMYHDCGQFYWRKVGDFERTRELVSANTAAYLVPEVEAQDIDDESDWTLAELKYRHVRGSNG